MNFFKDAIDTALGKLYPFAGYVIDDGEIIWPAKNWDTQRGNLIGFNEDGKLLLEKVLPGQITNKVPGMVVKYEKKRNKSL